MDCCDVCDYMFVGEPPEECPMCKIARLEREIAELRAEIAACAAGKGAHF
jgi:hypothetical protein